MRLACCRFGLLVSCLSIVTAAPGGARAGFFEKVGSFAMQFDQIAPDVRSRALGGAVVAAPSGPADVWWNPAALPTGHALQGQYAPIDWPADLDLTTMAMAAEWRNLRLCVARTALDMDPMIVRTAYQPEGNGQLFDAGSRAWTLNACADLAPWIFAKHPDLNLAFGVSARRLSTFVASTKIAVWDMDLGLLGARRWQGDGAWYRLRAAAMVRNVFRREIDFDQRTSTLPRDLRLGVAFEVGLEPRADTRTPVRVLLAYSRIQNQHGRDDDQDDHLGLELALFELIAPRIGYTGLPFSRASSRSYGCGFQLARPLDVPLGLCVDYAREDWGGWRDQWAFTLSGNL